LAKVWQNNQNCSTNTEICFSSPFLAGITAVIPIFSKYSWMITLILFDHLLRKDVLFMFGKIIGWGIVSKKECMRVSVILI
jgi:hypothetical protein